MAMVSFEEFVASRAQVGSVGNAIKDDSLIGVSGYTYLGTHFIEDADGDYGHKYMLVIGNWSEANDDLSILEGFLYEWYTRNCC
jgi:hypothetical protein